MYIIMYKYSAFRINYKSFRSSMSKNFTVIPGSSTVIPGSSTVIPGHDRGSSEQERHHPLPALNVTVMLYIRRTRYSRLCESK